MAPKIDDRCIKPICNNGELVGVEDLRRQQSVNMTLAPDAGYLLLADQCEYQRVCIAPRPKMNPLFRPPEPSTAGPADEPAVEEEAEPEAFDTDRPIDEIASDIVKTIDENMIDADGIITTNEDEELNVNINANDDGTATLDIHHVSPQTYYVLVEAAAGNLTSLDVWDSLEDDAEYLQEVAAQAMKKLGLPEDWTVEVSSQELKWDNGVYLPEEDSTTTFKLIPPEE